MKKMKKMDSSNISYGVCYKHAEFKLKIQPIHGETISF